VELRFNIHVAETAELKILVAEFEWLCELLLDVKSARSHSEIKWTVDSLPSSELLDVVKRFTVRLEKYREILMDEAVWVIMESVLAEGAAMISSGHS
jgi:hypothetical protein